MVMFEKWLIESLEDVGRYHAPTPFRELAAPWKVLFYALFRPGLWGHVGPVMGRWRADWSGRYVQVCLEAVVYICLLGLAACIIGFLILVI